MSAAGPTALSALRPREAAVFTALVEAYCRPEPLLPPVAATDALVFMDGLAARSRWLNRAVFKVTLRAIDLAPVLGRDRKRFTRLDPDRRARFVNGLDRSRIQLLPILSKLLKTLTLMSYYGDLSVLHAAGYDPEANVERGRALRRAEGRP
jgi:hypothetical protein